VSVARAPLVELRRRRPDPGRASHAYSARETTILLVACLALVDGLIHVGVALGSPGEGARYTTALILVAAAQLAWAAIVVLRPSAGALVGGIAFNLTVLLLVTFAKTGGGLAGPQTWSHLGELHGLFWCAASLPGAHAGAGSGLANLVETVGQVTAVAALASVLACERVQLARRLVARSTPVLAAALCLSVLYGFGAQAG
jgi:hypothetical protein